jgi:hypothetical protein
MKNFKDIREDAFDKSKDKNYEQLVTKMKGINVHIINLEKLDKQGEGAGDLERELKVLRTKFFEMQTALTKIRNRLV